MNKCFYCCFAILILFSASLWSNEKKNRIIVCENGLEMFQWDLDFIRSAEQSVEILACFFGGKTAQTILEVIEVRLSEVPDLQVYILASPLLLRQEDYERITYLQKKFPHNFHLEFSTQVARLMPEILSIDNHVKLCVVDETYFSAGGTNFEERHCVEGTFKPAKKKKNQSEIDTMLPTAMRDQDIVGRGPLAHTLRRTFFQLYAIWEHYHQSQILETDPAKVRHRERYFTVSAAPYVDSFETSSRVRELSECQIKCILGGPHQKNNAITKEYLDLIRTAKEEILLEHLYCLPIDPLLEALMEAVKRGVKLTLITNGLNKDSSNGAHFFIWGNRISYVPLFYGNSFHFWESSAAARQPTKNTEIFEYDVDDVWLHKKMMLIDRKILVIGSYNLSIKSAYGDYEIILVIHSEEVAQDALTVHEKDVQNSRRISPEMARSWYFDPIISCIGFMQKKFSGLL